MKKNALAAFGLLISLVSAGVVFGNNVSTTGNINVIKQNKITLEQAKKIALKKVEGKIEDEYTIENEDEVVISYVFIIKDKAGKTFEVQVDADDGEILSSEEQTDDLKDQDSQKPPQFNFS